MNWLAHLVLSEPTPEFRMGWKQTARLMKKAVLLLSLLAGVIASNAQLVQLFGPGDFSSNRTTLSFDEYPDYTAANTIYQNIGVTFSRDDGGIIPVFALGQYGFQVPSSYNVLFSGFFPGIGPTQAFTTHITVDSLRPLTEIGAFFGNDQYYPEFGFERISLLGANNDFLGSLDVPVNNNRDIDQFIGLRSNVPFYHARFENFTPSGIVSPGYSVAIDDLTFTAVPEPSSICLVLTGLACGWIFLRRRNRKDARNHGQKPFPDAR